MALVIIAESPTLTTEQKSRLGTVMVEALKGEGIAHTVVYFQPGAAHSLYVDGVLQEEETTPINTPSAEITMVDTKEKKTRTKKIKEEKSLKEKGRRSREDLETLKQQLIDLLHTKGSVSSFEATSALDLRDCTWAPATLRHLFGEMEDEKIIVKSGQKRGTRYALVPEAAPVLTT